MNARRPTSRRFGERSLWVAVVAALVVLSLSVVARAQGSTVLLIHSEEPSPLLREALVHVRGEFSSVDLSVQIITTPRGEPALTPELGPGTYGALSFEERGGVLLMRAYHPHSSEPIVQQLPLGDGRITPHVVAVRAVETLRAALQQYYHSANRQMPEKVKEFARIEEAKPPATQPPVTQPPVTQPPATQPPAPAPAPAPAPSALPTRARTQLGLWLAPSGLVDIANRKPAAGGFLALTVGRRWYHAGASFESTLRPFEFDAPSGSATLHRQMGVLEFRGRWEVTSAIGLFARIGGGVARYRLRGKAEAGFVDDNATHASPLVLLGAGAEYWSGSHVGVFIQVCGSSALNAPTVRFVGDPTKRLERPLLGIALGGVLGSGH